MRPTQLQAHGRLSNSYGSIIAQVPAKHERPPFGLIDLAAAGLSWLTPWLVFVVVSWLVSGSLRFEHPELCWFLVSLIALLVLLAGVVTYFIVNQSWRGRVARRPSWYIVVSASCLLALLSASVLGDLNYNNNMKRFYQVSALGFYHDVDPAKTAGMQIMDAGRIQFKNTAMLAFNLSAGFTNGATYCVAPVTTCEEANILSLTTCEALAAYDFWAVGIDCCSTDFRCGHGSSIAHSGLRVMDEELLPNFKLAVRQAEANFRIRALHPIFLEWVDDSTAVVNHIQEFAAKVFMTEALVFALIQAAAVLYCTTRYWIGSAGKDPLEGEYL